MGRDHCAVEGMYLQLLSELNSLESDSTPLYRWRGEQDFKLLIGAHSGRHQRNEFDVNICCVR